jgi:AmiR/NasT family two-component response regulator
VTGSKRSQTARDIDEAVRRSAESRGTIEQAKGVLMATLAIDAEQAFSILKRQSQNGNVKLRDLAALLLDVLADMRGKGLDARKAVEQLIGPDLIDEV